MKALHWILLALSLTVASPQCSSPFQSVPYGAEYYCVKCDTTCLTCSGGTINTCATCPIDFTFVASTSSCTPPASTTINTIDSVYHIFGFVSEAGWMGGSPYSCGVITALTAGPSATISVTYSFTPSYRLRVLVSVWWFSDATTVYLNADTTPIALQYGIGVASSANNATSTYQAYCSSSRATNVDYSFTDSLDTTLTISFTSASASWGIREFVFIQYKCLASTCGTCSGPLSSDCLTCADPFKAIFSGTCLCDYTQHYYKYPDSTNLCVNPCPTLLAGQYYGDFTTRSCVTQCPIHNSVIYYSSDVTNECVSVCPVSITYGGQGSPLYYDVVNRKCVTKCPPTQPYSYETDRKCYSTCPAGYYRLDSNLTCLSACPSTGAIPLVRDTLLLNCVYECTAVGYYADFLTGYCALSCSGGYFMDLSTERPICVQTCSYPLYFGDSTTVPSAPACTLTCPTGTYGDMAAATRLCVTTCSGGYFGLLTGNRACVPQCPPGTWGETLSYTCVNVPNRCSYTGYADNSTWLCVGGTNLPTQVCSNGQFKLNSTRTCVRSCPFGTYASKVTFFCQSVCVTPYFADSGVNECVLTCQTAGLFADVHSSRTCVSVCNQLGLTPYMDDSTRTCVNICPNSPYYFADPVTFWCTFNCTWGYYADGSVANKTCRTNCPSSYFGYNTTDYGICIMVCPDDSIMFGDIVNGVRVCVSVCQANTYGDSTGSRLCTATCPTDWFAQNDTLRRCVRVCNSTTFGWNKVCGSASSCPTDYTGDPSTHLCVNLCPASEGTFADFISKLCVQRCPIAGGVYYYADPTNRRCVATCNAANLLFGNNSTQTCQPQCLDTNAFADAQSTNRFCISVCTYVGAVKYYKNNYTMTCVVSTGCPQSYFADNSTQACVNRCPIISSMQTWGYFPTQTCVTQCISATWGDASTGIAYCVSLCPILPPKWSYDGNMTCMAVCPTSPSLFGEDFSRTCVSNCPRPPAVAQQTYAYDGSRRCLYSCPSGTYADYIQGVCFHSAVECILCAYSATPCVYRWADAFNNSCVSRCGGPTPDDSYGDNATYSCTLYCSANSYADNYTGTRICVATCPGIYNSNGVPTGLYDSFGDDSVNRCVLNCVTPNTWADWQTHKCVARCTGDTSGIPTYSENTRQRCTIALSCPLVPDKLYGENISRTCTTQCLYYSNGSISYADNITRTCIFKCYQLVNGSVTTRFYGDVSTGLPICVISCPSVPRLFGRNSTNLCVSVCPTNSYGDQTGNRSCVPICPIIGSVMWFSQITQQLCVTTCENGTWGNTHNQHCQTVATDCISSEYGDNSTSLCVALCPQSQNYFGDPTTKQCTNRCPNLLAPVINATAGINFPAIRFFADYSNRLCVIRCSANFGYTGTFGDNTTNTCVQLCPSGSYGDPNTINRYCVSTCTASAFADSSSMRCVSVCPSSPPTFGYQGNWTCLASCPPSLWANSNTRTCVSTCNPQYKLTLTTGTCTQKCPSTPDLYGDPFTYTCTAVCSNNYYADPTDRACKASCTPLFQYNYRCVLLCPEGYYANSLKNCVRPAQCDSNTYAENLTTTCTSSCPVGSYADSVSKYCIAVCPDGSYGDAQVCVSTCQTPSTTASTITQLCMSTCPNYTYALSGSCVATCTTGYRNDLTHSCASGCNTATTFLYADPTIKDCVATCATNYYRSPTGFCVLNLNECNPLFADSVTGNCVSMCSEGYWGYTGNYTCLDVCPGGYYGYTSGSQRTCYQPTNLPSGAPLLFGDPLSGTFVAVCSLTPITYFGDRVTQLCVTVCPAHSSTTYYGDPNSRQCQSTCTAPATYTADSVTFLCALKCSALSYRYNNTPICVSQCPAGYADHSTRICVAMCPLLDQTFGFHNTTSGDRLCVSVCPTIYYSDPISRTCLTICQTPYFAYNGTHQCRPFCVNSFADQSNRICVSQCLSTAYPFADNSTYRCVNQCPSSPDYYGDQHKCVLFCLTALYYADASTRLCVPRCPNLTLNSYGDPLTGRCVQSCSEGYWADNATNLCLLACPPNSFADNTTGKCVSDCPAAQRLYADTFLHKCVYTCSNGYFGSQVNQKCIPVCDLTYWGDPTTTLCVSACSVKYYAYGENVTRTCVNTTCPTGFADNETRLCVLLCQNSSTPRTFADPNTKACVQKCPFGYYADNITVTCVTHCTAGFADNYTNYCVGRCPSEPQSYGDQHIFVCLYSCLNNEFSDNSTNLCVGQCPSSPDYYGDPHNGKCVKFCTEGTYAHTGTRLCRSTCPSGSYADNLTRRCVAQCPPSQATYAESPSQKCVRVCRDGLWADNRTQTCVSVCPTWPDSTVTYAQNRTKYCVSICPMGYFGRNDTHACVAVCPVATDLYGHPQGRVCVVVTDCYPVPSYIYYADSVSRTCVQKCPLTLWADNSLFKCRTPCASGQYRNSHTQVCVGVCPTDPDEYADSSTGNCVRVCPPGSYAYVSSRTCVSSCGTYSLFADNSTNRCVSSCNTKPYLYADSYLAKCVYTCNSLAGYYADNMTQSCVPTCPAAWNYFGDPNSLLCVTLCPPNTYSDVLNGRTCVDTCTHGYFADTLTSACVQHCSSVRSYYYEDGPNKSCVTVCPGESYGYNVDQTCKYANPDSSSSCPGSYYADRASRQCVLFCPQGTFANTITKYCESACTGLYYADSVVRQCVTTCSPNTYAYQLSVSSNLCVQYCPSPLYAQDSNQQCVSVCTQLGLNGTRTCESRCPLPLFADNTNHVCVANCTPLFADVWLRQCITPCNSPAYSNPITFTCDLLCPLGYYGSNGTRSCVQTCIGGSYADPTLRLCVSQCSDYPLLFASGTLCLTVCPTTTYGYILDRTCRATCPNVSTLIYLADASNNLCVLECVNEAISFADYQHNVCTVLCPTPTFASNYTKECVSVCPTVPNNTFAQNTTRVCVKVCPENTFGDTNNGYCSAICTLPYFADPTTHLCVLVCPQGLFAYNASATCRANCLNSFADPTSRRCVAQCPALHDLFNYAGNNTCLLQCPPNFFADTHTYRCVSICDTTIGLYAYAPANTCVRECPVPYRGYAVNNTCILTCPSLYYYNIQVNTCDRCALTCLVCIDLSTCLQCIPTYNLFNGICGQSCIPTATAVTYASPSGQCVYPCPSGYYGDNTTYTCTQLCPNKQYGDSLHNLCLNCPMVCAQCTTPTHCTSCESGASLAVDSMCYAQCNATFPYSFNSSCVAACPAGTYLTYTNVICAACGSACLTCSTSPTHCLSCFGSYYYNNTCVSVCPTGFYGSPALVCLSCTITPSPACSDPLTFTTSYSVENYQPVFTIKFNQQVNITQNVSDILKVNLKLTRRLLIEDNPLSHARVLSVATLVNNGVPYTYEIMTDGTIKLYVQVKDNLVNPVFTLSVTDLSAIKSILSNTTLQNVNSDLFLPQLQFYPPQDSIHAPTNTAATFVVMFVLVLYLLSFIWSDYTLRVIQFMQLLTLHCVIDIDVPANMFYFLHSLVPSLFQFVKNFFASYYSLTPQYTNVSHRITDVFIDGDFLRNVGQIFVFMMVLGCFWVIFRVLSSKKIVENKLWHSLFESIAVNRFGMQVINDVIGVLYVPILYFGILSFSHFTSQPILMFSAFCAALFSLFCVVYPFYLIYVWAKKDLFYFLTLRIKETEEQSKYRNNVYALQSPIIYFYLILQCIWLVTLPPLFQPILLLLTNTVLLLYIMIVRPYQFCINSMLTGVMVGVMMVFQCFYLYFNVNGGTAAAKTALAAPMLYVVAGVLCVITVWTIARFVWEAIHVWSIFKKHEFYKQYADVDVPVEEEQSSQYDMVEKPVIDTQIRVGDVLVDQIFQEVKKNGEKKIRVLKKIWKKKVKKVFNSGDQEEYVRINSINPFDNIVEETKEKKREEKRHFDDDVRDIISEDMEENNTEFYGQSQEETQENKKRVQSQENQEVIANVQLKDESNIDENIIEEHSQEEKVNEIDFNEMAQSQEPQYYIEQEKSRSVTKEETNIKKSEIDQLVEDEGKKRKNLMFLFDEFDNDD